MNELIVESDEMRCFIMDWLKVQNLEELRNLGNFNSVRKSIKKFGGKTIHVSGRSWEELFESIKAFQEVIQKLGLSECKDMVNQVMVNPSSENTDSTVNDRGYFTTQASEYIFYLTELDGEARMNKLGITATHFSSKRKAKTWRDHISKVIHPDVCKHVHASDAMAQLNDLYNQMVGRE